MKKIIRYTLLLIALVIVLAITYVIISFPPIMTGMVAKTMCSCVYVTGRTPESVENEELRVFPGMNNVTYTLNNNDSIVTARLLGTESIAFYRKGLGCTLLSQRSLEDVQKQSIKRPTLNLHAGDTLSWPLGNIVKDTVLSGVNYEKVQQAIEYAFHDVDPKKPIFTHAVIAIYNGEIIGEKYADGFNVNSRLMGWSMTKSITATLIGILVNDGKLTIQQEAPVAAWKNDTRKGITINNLLQASSGLEWEESYFSPTSDFHNMFTKSDDKAAYAASKPLKYTPNTYFQYSSGTTNILSKIIRETVGDENYYTFPYERLFNKIGMYSAILEPDPSGTFVGSSYGYASARDWARLGMLYLNKGVWNGEKILPDGWVRYASTPADAAPMREYGAQVWLNLGNPHNLEEVHRPGIPHDAIMFDGFENNYVVIIPSQNLVVVRLGVTHNENFNLSKLVSDIIEALPQ
jgi:CubicO group peptidase (beta-lactamase class C family)